MTKFALAVVLPLGMLLIVAGVAAAEPPRSFDGFPEIGKYRQGERTLKVITSDGVSGLRRPQWTRAMGDLGGWPVMFRFKDGIFLVFYHGDGHRMKQFEASGNLKTFVSRDEGRTWREIASLPGESVPEFVPVGDTLYSYQYNETDRWTRVATSADGETWSEQQQVYQAPFYFWGVTYDSKSKLFWAPPHAIPNKGVSQERRIDLINSTDGIQWEFVSTVAPYDNASESTLRFEDDGTLLVLVRRKYGNRCTLASARPPYKEWELSDRPMIAEGEHFFDIGGRTYLASRANYQGDNDDVKANPPVFDSRLSYSAIYRFTPDRQFEPWAVMDSMGDCSYPFLVETPTEVLCAYYSQHEDSVCKVFLCGYDKEEFSAEH